MIVRRLNDNTTLKHHGIEGQKWGVRRFQNEDGTLTPEGRKRYGYNIEKLSRQKRKEILSSQETFRKVMRSNQNKKLAKDIAKESNEINKDVLNEMQKLVEQTKDRQATIQESNEYFKLARHNEMVKQAIRRKYLDRYADIYLSELGFENTEKGQRIVRKFLEKQHNKNTRSVMRGVMIGGRRMAVSISDTAV